MEAAIEQMEASHGGVDAYLRDGLGFDANAVETLRAGLLEAPMAYLPLEPEPSCPDPPAPSPRGPLHCQLSRPGR